MPKYNVESQPLIGFAAETIQPGEKGEVIKKASFTSDHEYFHVIANNIAGLFFSPINIPTANVIKALIIIHKNNRADIHVNDFAEISEAKLNRPLKKGEKVYTKDISGISKIIFPEIGIQKDDAIIYIFKIGWKFGLYFDFTRNVNLDYFNKEIGQLHYGMIFQLLNLQLEKSKLFVKNPFDVHVFVEGKSDWKHLEKAYKILKIGININFIKSEEAIGDINLLRMCKEYALKPQSEKVIFIFDSDNDAIIKNLERYKKTDNFQYFGNNVYSFIIPVPEGRDANISIEFYYSDDEIKTIDKNGRRLFLSSEFDKRTFKLISDLGVHTQEENKVKSKYIKIIDQQVFSASGNFALPKDDFANYIYQDEPNFNNFNFNNFKRIFEVISLILKD